MNLATYTWSEGRIEKAGLVKLASARSRCVGIELDTQVSACRRCMWH